MVFEETDNEIIGKFLSDNSNIQSNGSHLRLFFTQIWVKNVIYTKKRRVIC